MAFDKELPHPHVRAKLDSRKNNAADLPNMYVNRQAGNSILLQPGVSMSLCHSDIQSRRETSRQLVPDNGQ